MAWVFGQEVREGDEEGHHVGQFKGRDLIVTWALRPACHVQDIQEIERGREEPGKVKHQDAVAGSSGDAQASKSPATSR